MPSPRSSGREILDLDFRGAIPRDPQVVRHLHANLSGRVRRLVESADTFFIATGYRGEGAWSDRVQTEANFVEYWVGDALVLHLQKK